MHASIEWNWRLIFSPLLVLFVKKTNNISKKFNNNEPKKRTIPCRSTVCSWHSVDTGNKTINEQQQNAQSTAESRKKERKKKLSHFSNNWVLAKQKLSRSKQNT